MHGELARRLELRAVGPLQQRTRARVSARSARAWRRCRLCMVAHQGSLLIGCRGSAVCCVCVCVCVCDRGSPSGARTCCAPRRLVSARLAPLEGEQGQVGADLDQDQDQHEGAVAFLRATPVAGHHTSAPHAAANTAPRHLAVGRRCSHIIASHRRSLLDRGQKKAQLQDCPRTVQDFFQLFPSS
jgi:hypothetical protein